MPFAPGNKLWVESQASRKANRARVDDLLLILSEEGSDAYADMLDRLARNQGVDAPQLLFMEKVEKLLEYVRPKLARKEIGGLDGAPIQIQGINYLQPLVEVDKIEQGKN